jgi:hypothetical protein
MACCCFSIENTMSDVSLCKNKGISYDYGNIVRFDGDPDESEKQLFLDIVNTQKQQNTLLLRVTLIFSHCICAPPLALCCICGFCALKQQNATISQNMKSKAGGRKYGCKTHFGSTRDFSMELKGKEENCFNPAFQNPMYPHLQITPQLQTASQMQMYPQIQTAPQMQMYPQTQQLSVAPFQDSSIPKEKLVPIYNYNNEIVGYKNIA